MDQLPSICSKHKVLRDTDVDQFKIAPNLIKFIDTYCDAHGLERSTMRILDWGCGRGRTVGALRKDGIDSYGVEIDPLPFGNGRDYFDRHNLLDAVQLIGNDCKTSFPDAYFDVIFSEQVFEHVEDLDLVCAEMARITKRGGVGFHAFPAKWSLVEEHLKMPIVHWLPNNSLRFGLIYLFVLLGREPYWEHANRLSKIGMARMY